QMSYPASTDRWGARVPARDAKQGGGGCDRPHQAFGAAWMLGSRRSSPLCGAPYRQGGDDHRDRVGRAGLRPGRGWGVARGRNRIFYGVPLSAAAIPCHIWGSLVEKAGLRIEDIPKTWDAYFDFFKKVQDNLRKQGERKVYGLGFQVTANGVDPANLFNAFLIAYGGQDIVTKDGKLHLDDPKVRQAAIKAAGYLGGAYRDGYV